MLSGLLYWLSPARRRFMRRLAKPGLDATRARLAESGSPRAVQFVSTLLDANAEFLAYARMNPGKINWGSWAPAARNISPASIS